MDKKKEREGVGELNESARTNASADFPIGFQCRKRKRRSLTPVWRGRPSLEAG